MQGQQGCQNILHQVFLPHLENHKNLLQICLGCQSLGAEQSSLYSHGFLLKFFVWGGLKFPLNVKKV